MGFETRTMKNVLDMMLNGNFPTERPAGPRAPNPGETDSLGLFGGTVNHFGIALLALLVWARKKKPELLPLILPRIHGFLEFQLKTAFMGKGRASELLSPTHLRQHLQYVLGFLLVAVQDNREPLRRDCILWLRGLLALCRPFLVPVSSLEGEHNGELALVAPGFRGARKDGHGVGARDSQTERLCNFLLNAHPLALGPNPMQAVDDASLFFLRELAKLSPATVQELRQEPNDKLPPLRNRLEVQRKGKDFVAFLADKDGQPPPIQRFAGVIGGKLVFGFDDDQPPQLPGAQVKTLSGAALA